MTTTDPRDEFEAERAELGAIIAAGNATKKQLLKHRLLSQYWLGRCDLAVLLARMESINAPAKKG